MYEIKITFETEYELTEFTRKLDNATNYAVACEEFDQNLRQMVKYMTDENILKSIQFHLGGTHDATLRDAVDYCRSLFNETLTNHKVNLFD